LENPIKFVNIVWIAISKLLHYKNILAERDLVFRLFLIDTIFGHASVRPFLYFDPPTLLRPKPYFNFFGQTLLRPKLYYGLYFSINNNSRLDKRSKYASRSKEVEIERSKYRKGRRYENGRSTEKVELMQSSLTLRRLKLFSQIFSIVLFVVLNRQIDR